MTKSDKHTTARQILEIIPLVMRIVSAEFWRAKYAIVPAQFGVLFILANKSCNLSELAKQHAVSLPTMSSTVSKMVRQGWVKRTRAQHDRRMVLIEMTPAGEVLLEEISQQIVASVAELLQPLSADDQSVLLAGLAILRQVFA